MKIDHPQHPLGGPPGQDNKSKVPPGQAKKDFDTVLENIGDTEEPFEPEYEQEPEYEPEYEQENERPREARANKKSGQYYEEEAYQQLPVDDPAKRRIKREYQLAQDQEEVGIQETTVEEDSVQLLKKEGNQGYQGEKNKTMDPTKVQKQGSQTGGEENVSERGTFNRSDEAKKELIFTGATETAESTTGTTSKGVATGKSDAPGQTVRTIAQKGTGATGTQDGEAAESLLSGPEKAASIKEAIASLTEKGKIPGQGQQAVTSGTTPGGGEGKSQENANSKLTQGFSKVLEGSQTSAPGARPEFLSGLAGVPVASFVEPGAAPQSVQHAGMSASAIADLEQLVNRVAVGVNASGQPEFNLQLQMKELGEVQVRVTRAEQGIQIAFNAQSEKAGAQFAQNLSNLQTALEQKGLLVQNIQIMVQNQAVPLNQFVSQLSSASEQRPAKKDSKDSGKDKGKGSSAEAPRGGRRG